MDSANEKRMLNCEEVAEIYGLSLAMQSRARADWSLPFIRIGIRILYDRRDLEAYIKQYKVEPPYAEARHMPDAQQGCEVAQ